MENCVVCGGQEFYVEAGYYFCQECQTRNEGKREEVVEFRLDPSTRVRKTRIPRDKSSSGTEQTIGWTTWEKFNFILIGLTNELIELGVDASIKLTIAQLWTTYLRKLEVAFTSTTKKTVPRLSRRYNRQDAAIIYGRVRQKKKQRKRSKAGSGTSVVSSFLSGGSSNRELRNQKKLFTTSEYEKYMRSQESSDAETNSMTNQSLSSVQSSNSSTKTEEKIRYNKLAKAEAKKVKVLAKKVPKLKRKKFVEKYITSAYLQGPSNITPIKLWALLYVALRIHDEKIHLSDMLRYGREGHLSYYKLDHLLPPEVTLSRTEISQLNSTTEISYKGLRRTITRIAKFLEVWKIPQTNLKSLMERYCTELQLPNGILLYAERMMVASPPRMEFNKDCALIPNYEGRAMAFIIVVMKILFGLDGVTEHKISRVIERINEAADDKGVLDSRLFSFCEWQRYIEWRRCILVNEHFPTKLKFDPDSSGNSHLYVKFIQSILSKNEGDEPEQTKNIPNLVPQDLANLMSQGIERLAENMPEYREVQFFPPSLTPQYSYLQKLLNDPNKDIPNVLHQDFCATKVGYLIKPEALQELAEQCDIELNVIDVSAHFMEKIVETFQLPVLFDIRDTIRLDDSNRLTTVIAPSPAELLKAKKFDDPSEYLHRKYPGKIIIDTKKRRLFNKIQKSTKSPRNSDCGDFEFDQVHPNGKLKIPGSDDESDDDTNASRTIDKDYKLILSNFERQTLLNSVENPWEKRRRQRIYFSINRTLKKGSKETNKNSNTNDSDSISPNAQEITIIDDDTHDKDDNNPIIVQETSFQEGENSESDEISILAESIDSRQSSNLANNSMAPGDHEELTLFRPFKQHWMYRATLPYGGAPQYFRVLERNFPVNFRWLLHECAHAVEMSAELLYTEVCLVESYYSDVLLSKDEPEWRKKYSTLDYRSKANQTRLKKKWNS